LAAKKLKGLVIVESPAKAKKISGYLGRGYKVMASMGHVRDLPAKAAEIPAALKKEPWSNLGVNVDSEFEPLYVIPSDKKKLVKELKSALKTADELILATDEDREGESIGWHLAQLLKPKVPVSRMVFSEITKDAILNAIKNPRPVDENLVSAQETRRVLDRLYGYTLSPLLWKKIARGLSAGRVQSVAVKILVLREHERLAFRSADYWDLKAELRREDHASFTAQLITSAGKRVASGRDFDENTGKLKPDADVVLLDADAARSLQSKLTNSPWKVASIKQRSEVRKPYPPFTTSTLQQEGNRKLGMTARQTMQVAQRLYEAGYITYMRTDSVYLSKEAIDSARACVEQRFGDAYLHASVRQFTNRNQSAQEAHEAIRPAGTDMKTAEELGLSGRERSLYSLIWKRTVSTQMAEARLQFRTVTVEVGDCEFRATGRTVEFPGFFRAYVEGVDDPQAALDDQESSLPPMAENDTLNCEELQALEHRTSPPARFTEATLVRELEKEGVGRPSTYASIIGTIQDRGYVRKSGSQLVPTFTALAVTRLLQDYFPQLVDIKFTADMEKTLDDIATGNADRLPYLDKFYRGADGLDEQVKKNEDTIDPRQACTLKLDGFDSDIRVGRWGPYFEKVADGEKLTASIPGDIAPADVTNDVAEKLILEKQKGPRPIGMHPEEGLPIYAINGPFGPYVQLGDVTEEQPKPKRVSLTNQLDSDSLTLDTAIKLLELPKRLGHHPETGKVVNVGIGRFGPYVLHDKTYGNFDRKTHLYTYQDQTYDALSVNLEVAVDMLKHARKRSAPTPIKELGPHPDDGETVAVFEGRYGPYVKHGKINATIPKDHELDSITLDDALPWLADKAAKKATGGRGRATKKKATKKKATKKKAAKKKAAKKKAGQKKAGQKKPAKKTAAKKTAAKKKAAKKKTSTPAAKAKKDATS